MILKFLNQREYKLDGISKILRKELIKHFGNDLE
jgi:hypothetical protein